MIGFFSRKKKEQSIEGIDSAWKMLDSLDPSDPCLFLDGISSLVENLLVSGADTEKKAGILSLFESRAEPHLVKIERIMASGARMPKAQEDSYRRASGNYLLAIRNGWEHYVKETRKRGDAYCRANVRIMSSIRRRMLWDYFFYIIPARDLLVKAGRIYVEARNGGWEGDETESGDALPSGSVVGELVMIISLALSSCSSLSPHQTYLVYKIIELLHRDFTFRLSRSPGSTFFFSTSVCEKPGRIVHGGVEPPSDSVFVDMHDARTFLESWIRSADDGQTPTSIFKEYPEVTSGTISFVLKHLISHWFFDAAARRHQRVKTSVRLDIVGGIEHVFEHFGKPSPQDAEIWTCYDISVNGFAASLDKKTMDWVRIGAPLAVHVPNKPDNEWGVGVIRRMVRKESGQTDVAVEMFSLDATKERVKGIIGKNGDCLLLGCDEENDTCRILTRNMLFTRGEKSIVTINGNPTNIFAKEIIELWSGFQIVEYAFHDISNESLPDRAAS